MRAIKETIYMYPEVDCVASNIYWRVWDGVRGPIWFEAQLITDLLR